MKNVAFTRQGRAVTSVVFLSLLSLRFLVEERLDNSADADHDNMKTWMDMTIDFCIWHNLMSTLCIQQQQQKTYYSVVFKSFMSSFISLQIASSPVLSQSSG